MTFATDTQTYGPGTISPTGALTDADLLDQVRRYKRVIAKRYRVIDADKVTSALPEGELIVSTKIDGQLWFFVKRGAEAALCSYNGRVLSGIPLVGELATQAGDSDVLIAGELFVQPESGRPRVAHVSTVLGDGSRAAELQFRAFDLLYENTDDGMALPYAQRLERLLRLCGETHVVESKTMDRDAVPACYQDWVASEAHEGLVVRTEYGFTYKIKPTISIDASVVAFGARIRGDGHELRELTVALKNDDGSFQVVGTVGGGFSDQERLSWYTKLQQKVVASSYRLANSEGTLCHFVQPDTVVEITCSDLLLVDGHDRPLRRMRLSYDDGYTAEGPQTTAVLLHPRFARERDDKTADSDNAGMTQITSRVDIQPSTGTQSVDLAAASVLQREVYVKVTKERKSVRKFVLVQTNKLPEDGFAPFALFATDYSPGRAEPLKTSITVAGSQAIAEAQVESWKTANIKRGWNVVE